MKQIVLAMATMATVGFCAADRAGAQCNPACQGDFDSDGHVAVDELVTAVNNALNGCPASPEQLGCLASGGTVTTALCCAGGPAFPDSCGIGPCGCSPQNSEEVSVCHCPAGDCYDRIHRACVPINL